MIFPLSNIGISNKISLHHQLQDSVEKTIHQPWNNIISRKFPLIEDEVNVFLVGERMYEFWLVELTKIFWGSHRGTVYQLEVEMDIK